MSTCILEKSTSLFEVLHKERPNLVAGYVMRLMLRVLTS